MYDPHTHLPILILLSVSRNVVRGAWKGRERLRWKLRCRVSRKHDQSSFPRILMVILIRKVDNWLWRWTLFLTRKRHKSSSKTRWFHFSKFLFLDHKSLKGEVNFRSMCMNHEFHGHTFWCQTQKLELEIKKTEWRVPHVCEIFSLTTSLNLCSWQFCLEIQIRIYQRLKELFLKNWTCMQIVHHATFLSRFDFNVFRSSAI